MAKITILGSGYLATALKKKIGEYSWYPTEDTEIVYYMDGPTHLDFAKNPSYFSAKEDAELNNLLGMGYKVVYPSSALVYEMNTKFTQHKKNMERLVLDHGGIVARLFPVYGYEEKTFIGQAIKDMKNGESPLVYRDGEQTRDFIFIEDVIDKLLSLTDTGLYDIGTGVLTSFNEIVRLINEELGTDISPKYIEAPPTYVQEGVVCKVPQLLIIH